MEGNNGRLVLTLCVSNAGGSYKHAMIPLPRSYEAAVGEARRVFQPYVGNLQSALQPSNIVLKCAIKRANGTGAWGILRPTDWSSVIRPDGDEVGVFIRQDSLDLPYEPMESGKANKPGKQKLIAQQPGYDNPLLHTSEIQLEKKIMYLILKTGDMTIGNEKSTMIKVPATYQECQAEAYKAFKTDFATVAQSAVVLESKRGERRYGSLDSWSVVTPAAYKLLVSTSGDRIDLWVSGPPRPSWQYYD